MEGRRSDSERFVYRAIINTPEEINGQVHKMGDFEPVLGWDIVLEMLSSGVLRQHTIRPSTSKKLLLYPKYLDPKQRLQKSLAKVDAMKIDTFSVFACSLYTFIENRLPPYHPCIILVLRRTHRNKHVSVGLEAL